MVSVLRSEDGSEADISLHISDYDTDGENITMNSTQETVFDMELEEENKTVGLAINDAELIEKLDQVIGEDVEKSINAEIVVKNITKDILNKYKKDKLVEDKSPDKDVPKVNKEEEDLLQVMDEKAAEEDANEYEMTIAEMDEDSEEATLKDDTITTTEISKSPVGEDVVEEPGCEESKLERTSPADMMDIGDSVLDIGDVAEVNTNTTEVIQEDVYKDDEKSKESDEHSDESHIDEDIQDETILDEDIQDEDMELVENIDNTIEVNNIIEEVEQTVVDQTEENKHEEDISDVTTETQTEVLELSDKPHSSVKVALGEKMVEEEQIKETVSDVENKENLDASEMELNGKRIIIAKSLRKRVSTDGSDNEQSNKKLKTEIKPSDIPDITLPIAVELSPQESTIHEEKEEEGEKEEKEENEDKTKKLEKMDVKLCPENTDIKPDTDTSVKSERKLKFKALMADKTMAGMTRETLEAFATQIVCEALVYKTEIAALLKCIKDRDLTIELLQKEVVSLNKQSKDLCIVHEKILQDLHRCMKLSDKPLLVPRITRSVGLQASFRDSSIKKTMTTGTMAASTAASKVAAAPQKIAKKAPPAVVTHTALPAQLANVMPPSPKQLVLVQSQVASQVNQVQSSQGKVPVKISPAKVENKPVVTNGGASVIDLTSDDDRKPQMSGTKLLPAPQGHQLVVANSQQVMVKLPTQANFLINNGVKVITTSITQPSVLRSNAINSITTSPRSIAPSQLHPILTQVPAPRLKQSKVVYKKHPAPFPPTPITNVPSLRPIPPRPHLTLSKTKCGKGIVLSWKINSSLELYSEIASYQIYAYQETKAEPRTENWSKVGDVKALQLPMAVTLTQFAANNRYYFAVRAVDILTRVGPFSDYRTIGN